MAHNFRIQVPRQNKNSRKTFLIISTVAWGLPILLTISCCFVFKQPNVFETQASYTPTLMETRVCYMEPTVLWENTQNTDIYFFKFGTVFFYFGPVCLLVVCNMICLVVTLRKVQYLRRGNSVLRREEDQVRAGHTKGGNPQTAHTSTGEGKPRGGGNKRGGGRAVDSKTIKLYIKMVLMTGVIELLSEVVMWLTTIHYRGDRYFFNDIDLAYRAAGYVTDFFRAAIVAWMAAPDGGYLSPVLRRLRGDKGEKGSPRTGNGGRRKQNVA